MSQELLAKFQQTSRNLRMFPLLTKQELDEFQVNYGAEIIEELKPLVDDDPFGNSKIIFTGHRGCRKSTLLAEFSQAINDQYFIVFFSIADIIEMSDVNHINILFAIAVQLMTEAEKKQIKIEPSIKEQFYNWFATHTRIEKKELGVGGSIGINLFKLITGKLQADRTVRDEIKQEFLRDISKLIRQINEIASVVQIASNQDILIIIDDLDKLDLAVVRDIYRDNIKALFKPNLRIIFTLPIAALREVTLKDIMETETNNQIVFMPVYKLFKKGENRQIDALPIPKTTETLLNVLSKRIPSKLIEPETAKQIVIYSGGVLREVIRIANECCKICLRIIRRNHDDDTVIINQEVLQEAVKNLRLDFDTRLGKADYEILENTYHNFKPNDPKEQRFLDLLHALYVLEYRNDQLWYDVHPIVAELLDKNGEN